MLVEMVSEINASTILGLNSNLRDSLRRSDDDMGEFRSRSQAEVNGTSDDLLTEEVSNSAKMERPKSKKRVTFESDESLVQVQEIPRISSPALTEELYPCDPAKLAVQVAKLDKGSNQVASPKKSTVIDIISQISKMGIISRAQNQKIVKDWCITGSKKSQCNREMSVRKDGKAAAECKKAKKPKTAQESRTHSESGIKPCVDKSTSHSKTAKQTKNPRKLGLLMDNSKLHVGTSYPMKRSVSTPGTISNNFSSNYNKNSVRKRCFRILSASDLDHKPANSSSFGKIRLSPYRQSSAPPNRSMSQAYFKHERSSSSRTKEEISLEINNTPFINEGPKNYRAEYRGVQVINRIDSMPPGMVGKVHAWQMANGDLDSHNVTTPCISQMWDSPKLTPKKIDPQCR